MTRVLWVDDEVTTGDPVVTFLLRQGYSLDLAGTGAEALDRLHDRAYDALLLDLQLPDMGGVILLDQLRQQGIDSPVIVLTGFATIQAAAATMRLGAVNLLEKPLDFEEMDEALQLALSARVRNGRRHAPARDLTLITNTLDALCAQEDPASSANIRFRAIRLLADTLMHPFVPYRVAPTLASALGAILTGASRDVLRERLARLKEQCGRDVRLENGVAEKILREWAAQSSVISEHDLASFSGISPRTLGRMLRRDTGLNFREWRMLLRIMRVLRELLYNREQIAQIAFRCGYEHPSQLDRDFRRVLGMSPRRLRAILQQAEISSSDLKG